MANDSLHEVSLFVDDETADIVADGLDDANVARRWASLRVHDSFLHRVMDVTSCGPLCPPWRGRCRDNPDVDRGHILIGVAPFQPVSITP